MPTVPIVKSRYLKDVLTYIESRVAETGKLPSIHDIRSTVGISQRDMAAICGVALRTYTYWESGRFTARVELRRPFMDWIEQPFFRHREVFGPVRADAKAPKRAQRQLEREQRAADQAL